MCLRRALEERNLLLHVISQNARVDFSSSVKHKCFVGCPAALVVCTGGCAETLVCHGGNTWQRGRII